MMKYVLSLIVGLAVVAGSVVFAEDVKVVDEKVQSLTVGQQFTNAIKAAGVLSKTDKVAAYAAVKAVLDNENYSIPQQASAARLMFWWTAKRWAERIAWIDTLPKNIQAVKGMRTARAYAYYRIGRYAEAMTIAKANDYTKLFPLIALEMGNKAEAYGYYRDKLLSGGLSPKQFISTLGKLRNVSLAVTNAVYLKTLNDASRFCHPAEQDWDLWQEAASKLDMCKRDLAAIVAAE